ncbi:MAG: hypothetical protein ACI8W1_002715, partial [Candidatus Azotimanducaceae bacterium]
FLLFWQQGSENLSDSLHNNNLILLPANSGHHALNKRSTQCYRFDLLTMCWSNSKNHRELKSVTAYVQIYTDALS